MIKLAVLYNHPADKEAFDKHYNEVHIPLMMQLQNMQRVEVAHVTGAPRGESPYYLIAELYWENADMVSQEMHAVGKDARQLAGENASMHIAEVIQ